MLTILRNFQRSFVKRFAFQNFFQKRNKNTKRTQMRRANVIFCVQTRFLDRQTLRNSTASMNLRDGRGNVDETRFRQSYPQSYPPLYRRPAAAPKTRGETNLIHPCRKLDPFPCCCVRCCCAVLCACVRACVRACVCVRASDVTSKQREKPHKIEVVRGVMGPPFEMYCGRPMFHFLGSPGAAHRKLFCTILLAGF